MVTAVLPCSMTRSPIPCPKPSFHPAPSQSPLACSLAVLGTCRQIGSPLRPKHFPLFPQLVTMAHTPTPSNSSRFMRLLHSSLYTVELVSYPIFIPKQYISTPTTSSQSTHGPEHKKMHS